MSKLNKLQNLPLATVRTDNPYKAGSFKRVIWAWCLERGEFSKQEFLDAVIALKEEYEVTSKMSDDVLGKAWYNEFLNKHHDLVVRS